MNILELLESLNTDKPGRKAVNELVEMSYNIAYHCISVNIRKIFKQIAIEGDTIEELAIEAITPLFLPAENNRVQIANSFMKWSEKIESEKDAFYFLNKIISRRVNQHITLMLKKSDPFFAKIYDSVNYLIKKEGLKKQNYFGTMYIVEKKIRGKVINGKDFENIPAGLLASHKNLLSRILKYLEYEAGYFPAIPVNSLVKNIKHLSFDSNSRPENISNHLLNYELKECLDSGLKDAYNKLDLSYYKNGKLNEYEVKSIELSLHDMAVDLMDGGLKPGLYEYLRLNMPDLKKDQFHNKYQNILEYLLKVMKKKVGEELTK